MNAKNNQRTRLSKMLLQNALMDLLKEKGSVSKISVREICSLAELNRSTFYAHYSTPEDLLEEIEGNILRATNEYLTRIGKENNIGAHRYLTAFLEYIKEQDKQFRILLIELDDSSFRRRFMQMSMMQFMENMRIEFDKRFEQYILAYVLSGSTGVITQWIRSGYGTPMEELCSLLFAINQSALVNLGEYTL